MSTPQSPVPNADPFSHLRHDLRTPINQILGYSEMLEEEAVSLQPGFVPDLQKIQLAARNMLAVIQTRLTGAAVSNAAVSNAAVSNAEVSNASRHIAPAMELTAASSDLVDDGEVAQLGHLLVVDDNELNRDMLAQRLLRQGHTVGLAKDGEEALALVRATAFDLVLLDILMPGIDGYGVLTQMKADAALQHIPVIMISALDELSSVVRCIEAGAEDYLPKPFNPTLLRARIGACLEKKQLRDQERKTFAALADSQRHLAAELAEAADYVTSLLPVKLKTGVVTSDWRFLPSTSLGGDAFGYHWIDKDHLAVYLLDVCGHGVGAALLSISAMNVIRSQSLPATDFRRPCQVLGALNEAFPMDAQNDMYFTIWYGVFERSTCQITYGSAGHNPSILIADKGKSQSLSTKGPIIGLIPGMEFPEETQAVPPGSRLFVFSDGTYELLKSNGSRMEYEEFADYLESPSGRTGDLDAVIQWARDVQDGKPFDDDFSILWLQFAASPR